MERRKRISVELEIYLLLVRIFTQDNHSNLLNSLLILEFLNYSGKKISRIGIGTASFGGSISERKAKKALSTALENGINYIDTASSYGYGKSEEIIGELTYKQREQVFITTKFGIQAFIPAWKRQLLPLARQIKKYIPSATHTIQKQAAQSFEKNILSLETIKKSIATSLQKLKTSYLDQLMIHNYFEDYLRNEEVMNYLFDLRNKRIIHHLGLAVENLTIQDVELLKSYTTEIDFLQTHYQHQDLICPLRNDFYINFFAVFSQSSSYQESKKHIQQTAKIFEKGHFLITMNTPKHIVENITLLD